MTKTFPLKELFLVRVRELIRAPEAVFWVYGFPILLAIGLGMAFRNRPPDTIFVDIQEHPQARELKQTLDSESGVVTEIHSAQDCATRLRLGKSSIILVPEGSYTYIYDPTRPESAMARMHLDDMLQRAAGRKDRVVTRDRLVTEPGARYIDFLIPGLLGMNLFGGGLWGVGFVTVDLRIRKLLKRLMATPMRKRDFLFSLIGGRLAFMLPEVVLLLGTGVLLFHVQIHGSLSAILTLTLVGAVSFAGLGLLVACRADKMETISGLMNLVMLPMWLFSGIFFSADRFPDAIQPFVQALPLTQLNNALRAVILEGASLGSQSFELAVLAAWGLVCFLLALRFFRWN